MVNKNSSNIQARGEAIHGIATTVYLRKHRLDICAEGPKIWGRRTWQVSRDRHFSGRAKLVFFKTQPCSSPQPRRHHSFFTLAVSPSPPRRENEILPAQTLFGAWCYEIYIHWAVGILRLLVQQQHKSYDATHHKKNACYTSWGTLYADETPVFCLAFTRRTAEDDGGDHAVSACAAFELLQSQHARDGDHEPANERRARGGVPFTDFTLVGQAHKQTIWFVHVGGAISADGDLRWRHRAACAERLIMFPKV